MGHIMADIRWWFRVIVHNVLCEMLGKKLQHIVPKLYICIDKNAKTIVAIIG